MRSFSSTLNFAVINLNNESTNDTSDFENNFDKIMQKAASYIQKIVIQKYGTLAISEEELNDLILEDYSNIVDSTFQNTDIYSFTMNYIAFKYLDSHREEIPQLLRELEEKGLTYSEEEYYTDDFHQNLLYGLLSLQEDFRIYQENMFNSNAELLEEIESFTDKYGKVEGFKRYCDQYHNKKNYPFTLKRHYITYAYCLIFGLEGLDEKKLPPKSPILKYKKLYSIKEFTTAATQLKETYLRDELKASIMTTFLQLDNLGEITDNLDIHNNRMQKVALPGLQYFSEEATDEQKYPKVNQLLTPENLDKLDIDTLLRLNSFYNNRFAKSLDNYLKALFVLENTQSTHFILEGKTLSANSLPKDVLDILLLKYETLIIPTKSFYIDSQNELDANIFNNTKPSSKITYTELENGKQQIEFSLNDFAKNLKKSWKKEYENYFNKRLPNTDNNLYRDILFIGQLYNPIFLSYQFKNMALKAEYAYMFYVAEKEKSKSLNYGIVLDNNSKGHIILLASDGGLNFPNRLHTNKRSFTDFILSYTGQPLVRIYEGFDDFFVGNLYITTQLLLPIAKQHQKYLKDLQTGKLKNKEDSVSQINNSNQRFIEHMAFCMDSTKFMESHKIVTTSVDKKGNPIQIKEQPVRYMDLTTGTIYSLNKEGKLIDRNGMIFGEADGR